LREFGEVDVLVSGIQADIDLPFDVKYRYHGLSFIFGKNGGVDLWKTFISSTVRKFVKEVNAVPVVRYDLAIHDSEPISRWGCYVKGTRCIGLSHQSDAFVPVSPKPEEIAMDGRFIMKHYAPPSVSYGFHFKTYAPHIFTPDIRESV